MDLPALDRNIDRRIIGKPNDLLDMQPDGIMQDDRNVIPDAALGTAPEYQGREILPARLLDRFHRRVLAHAEYVGVVLVDRRSTVPGQLARLELNIVAAEETEDRHVRREHADRAAVVWR